MTVSCRHDNGGCVPGNFVNDGEVELKTLIMEADGDGADKAGTS